MILNDRLNQVNDAQRMAELLVVEAAMHYVEQGTVEWRDALTNAVHQLKSTPSTLDALEEFLADGAK